MSKVGSEYERSSQESDESDPNLDSLKMPEANSPKKKGKYSQKLKKLFRHYVQLKKIKNYNELQKMMANAQRVV